MSESGAPPPPASTTFPPDNEPPTGGGPETLDDSDPRIIYSSSNNETTWTSSRDNHDGVYNNTLHTTSNPASYVTLLFNGTGVAVTSLLSPTGAAFTAILDGTASGPYSLQIGPDQTPRTASVFTAQGLSLGQHNITILKAEDQSGESEINIDSFGIMAMDTGASSTTSGRTETLLPGVGPTQTGTDGVPVPTDSEDAPSTTQSKRTNTGAIVGGVVGGIAFLAVIIAAWCIIKRTRRSKRY